MWFFLHSHSDNCILPKLFNHSYIFHFYCLYCLKSKILKFTLSYITVKYRGNFEEINNKSLTFSSYRGQRKTRGKIIMFLMSAAGRRTNPASAKSLLAPLLAPVFVLQHKLSVCRRGHRQMFGITVWLSVFRILCCKTDKKPTSLKSRTPGSFHAVMQSLQMS